MARLKRHLLCDVCSVAPAGSVSVPRSLLASGVILITPRSVSRDFMHVRSLIPDGKNPESKVSTKRLIS